MFIQYLAEQGHNVVKSERKPRRNIQYRDLCTLPSIPCFHVSSNKFTASAVSHLDNLEFLVDIVPKTVQYKDVKREKKTQAGPSKVNGESSAEVGQTTLDGLRPTLNGTNGMSMDDGPRETTPKTIADSDDPNAQLEMEMEIRGARTSLGSAELNGKEHSQDVEMH